MEKQVNTQAAAKKLNNNTFLPTSVRVVGYVLFAILAITLILGLELSVMHENPDATIFGGRYQSVTAVDAPNTVIPEGTLVFINVGGEYAPNQAVSYKYLDDAFIEHVGVATAAYAESLEDSFVIGPVSGMVPALGYVLDNVANDLLLAAVMAFVAALILVLLINVGNKKGGRVKVQQRKRISIQTLWFIFTNSYMIGYVQGKIYQGPIKNICVPGMNCYSCPGAWGACPIGALQSVFNSRDYSTGQAVTDHYFSFYVVGIIMLFGAICGRFVCGFLCPFGWIQELLAKIPVPKSMRINTFPGDKILRWLKFVVLGLFVVIMPLFIVDDVFPWFCKLICPSGMAIGGIPLMSVNEDLRSAAGNFTILKLCMLALIVLLSIVIYRPFCKYLCPLGAIYGVLNLVSVYKYSVDETKCNDCGACVKTCRMGVDIRKTPNSIECIRCGDCRAVCPKEAIYGGFKKLPARISKEDLTIN